MLWDTHMHSRFSGDSEAEPEAMIKAAMDKGLSGICFTDHLDYDFMEEPGLFELDIPAYRDRILTIQKEYEERFPVNFGIEIGLQTHLVERNNAAIDSADFDFVIGSSHVVDGIDPYYPPYFENKTDEQAHRRYFESVLENINMTDAVGNGVDYDVYGHLDYIVRYGPNQDKNYTYQKYADIIDEILRTLIRKDKGIEVNTGGLGKGIREQNPCFDIIRRYHELGGEIITLGADAHTPDRVAQHFDIIPDLLKKAGFEYFTVFTARTPCFMKLP